MLKNSFFVFMFFSLLFSQNWVAKYNDFVFYEEDLYRYIPRKDWTALKDLNKKRGFVLDFIKQEVGVIESQSLGLQYDQKTYKKIKGRFERLLVNEYYMRAFLGKIIPKEKVRFCQQHLKREVFVNHVLLPLGEKGFVFAEALKDSILKGELTFKNATLNHSIDPTSKQNFGSLGWISLGQTVPEFQDAIFNLCEGCVALVTTSFGHHVIRIDSSRASEYSLLDQSDYNDFSFRFASGYITENLAEKAAKHDSMLIVSEGVFLSRHHLSVLIGLIQQEKERLGAKTRKDVDVLGVLNAYPNILAKYKGDLLTSSWFVNKINSGFYKNVYYDNVDQMYSEFITILIRDIVFHRALALNLDVGVSFNRQFLSVKKDVLYKSFLKHLSDSVSDPTPQEIEAYYNQTELKSSRSLAVATESVRAVLLQQKQKDIQAFFDFNVDSLVVLNLKWLNNE